MAFGSRWIRSAKSSSWKSCGITTKHHGREPAMMTFSEAYHGKRVLVTGLTGFKGQWLGKWLKQLGAEVSGFGLAPLTAPDGSAPQLATCFDVEMLDVRDAAAVNAFFAQTQ